MATLPTTVNASFAHLKADGPSNREAWLSVRLGSTTPPDADADVDENSENATKIPANAALDIAWDLTTHDGDVLASSADLGAGLFLFRDDADGGGTGAGSVTFIELYDEQSTNFPTTPASQGSGTVQIPAANLQNGASYKVVLVFYDNDGTTPPSTANINTDGEFYVDADNNAADQSGIGGTPALDTFTVGRVGWLRVGLNAQSLTLNKTAAGGNATAGVLRFPNTFTISGNLHDFGVNNPKNVEVGIDVSADGAGSAFTKSQSLAPASGTGAIGPTSSFNTDTHFPDTDTNHRLRARINSGVEPDVIANNTKSAGFPADTRWAYFESAAAGMAKTGGSDYTVEDTTDISVLADIDFFEDSALTTQGVKVFQSSSYATEREVFRRKGPTITQQATPHLETYVTDGDGTKLEGVSIKFDIRDENGSPITENTQTLATESGANAGRRRWNWTVPNNARAFNRFKKAGGDNPQSPPAERYSATLTTLAENTSIGAGNVLVADSTPLNVGDVIVVDHGGANEEQVVIQDLNYNEDFMSLLAAFTKTHSNGDSIKRVIPIYPKKVRVTGTFASNNPTDESTDEFGVNSELHAENMWTGDLADATIDASGTPTGKAKLSKQSGGGTVQFKLSTAIDRDTGNLLSTTEHNIKTADGQNVVVTTDDLAQRKAIWDVSNSQLELSPANSNIALNQNDAYANNPNSGFESYDVTGDGRTVDIALAAADTTGQRGTFTVDGQPGGTGSWLKGKVPSGNIGFTGDTGNYGFYVVRMSFFVLDVFVFIQAALSEDIIPPGGTPHISIQVNRRSPDGSLTPVKADDNLKIYIAEDGGAGVGLTDIVVNDESTPINPDVNGKSAQHEYTPPAIATSNGTYSVEIHGSAGGSPIVSRGIVQYTVGDPNTRFRLISDIGHGGATEIGHHLIDGSDVEFGCILYDADSQDRQPIDDDGTAIVVITRKIGGGSEEFFDQDETWKPFTGNTPYEWPLTVAGDQLSAKLDITNMTLGDSDIVAAFAVNSGGATYTDRVFREVVGTLGQHDEPDTELSLFLGEFDLVGRLWRPGDDFNVTMLALKPTIDGQVSAATIASDVQSHAITGVDTVNDQFVISGDHTEDFFVGAVFDVSGSTGNDGTYRVSAVSYAAGPDETTVTVVQDVTDATVDGNLDVDEKQPTLIFLRIVDGNTETLQPDFTWAVTAPVSLGFPGGSGLIPGADTAGWVPPSTMFIFGSAIVLDNNGNDVPVVGEETFEVVESRNIEIPVVMGSLHGSSGDWKPGHGFTVSADIISVEDDGRLDADVETDGPDVGEPKVWVILMRPGDATTGTQYLHSDNTWHNVKDVGTGGEPATITRHRLQKGSTSLRYFEVFHDTAPFDSGFDTSTWDTSDLTALVIVTLNDVEIASSATEDIGLRDVNVSIAAGDNSHSGNHAVPGETLTFGAAVEDDDKKLTLDGANSLIPSTLDPDAEIAIRRFRASDGDLEEWNGSAWVEVADGEAAFTYHPMSRASTLIPGGDPDLAIYQLPGSATEGDTGDILYRVRVRSGGVRYTTSGSLTVVDGYFRHDGAR